MLLVFQIRIILYLYGGRRIDINLNCTSHNTINREREREKETMQY